MSDVSDLGERKQDGAMLHSSDGGEGEYCVTAPKRLL